MKCIFCDTNKAESKEHPFPESIGGVFFIQSLCHSCNSKFGTQVDSKLIENLYVYEAYQQVRAELGSSKRFKLKEAKLIFEDGYQAVASRDSRDKKAYWTEISPNLFRTHMEDIQSVITKFSREAASRGYSNAEIDLGKEEILRFHSGAKAGDAIQLGPFKLEVVGLGGTKDSVLSTEYPFRFACKLCTEFAHFFGISDEIKNIEEIKRYAKDGKTLGALRFKYGKYQAEASRPEHTAYFGVQYFTVQIYFSVFVLIELEWKDTPRYFGFTQNLKTGELQYGSIGIQ